MIERQARERTEAGLALDGLPDLSAEGERDGFYRRSGSASSRFGTSRAGPGSSWRRTGTPDAREHRRGDGALPVGERFFHEFTLRQVLLNAAKSGCGPSAAGTSSRAEGPNTAKPAATTTCPAPEVSPEPTDGSAPIASTP